MVELSTTCVFDNGDRHIYENANPVAPFAPLLKVKHAQQHFEELLGGYQHGPRIQSTLQLPLVPPGFNPQSRFCHILTWATLAEPETSWTMWILAQHQLQLDSGLPCVWKTTHIAKLQTKKQRPRQATTVNSNDFLHLWSTNIYIYIIIYYTLLYIYIYILYIYIYILYIYVCILYYIKLLYIYRSQSDMLVLASYRLTFYPEHALTFWHIFPEFYLEYLPAFYPALKSTPVQSQPRCIAKHHGHTTRHWQSCCVLAYIDSNIRQ